MLIDNATYRSPNHSARKQPIDSIVIHSTEGLMPGTALWLSNPKSKVSCHFLVARDGQVYQLVDLARVAWHSGICLYGGRIDWNSRSIGIELEHVAGQDWPEVQRQALTGLCKRLIPIHNIPQKNIVAHRWIAFPRGRKADPSNWPDKELRAWIAGLYGETTPSDVRRYRVVSKLPARIRERASARSAIIGRLWPGSTLTGRLVTNGEVYDGDARWVKLEPGPGYIWYGLLETSE